MASETNFNYSNYDLVDEQLVNVETIVGQQDIYYSRTSNSDDYAIRTILNESIISVGNSRWYVLYFYWWNFKDWNI